MASASSSNATCSTTVCSTPSSRAHTLLNRTPFHPLLEPSLQTAGNLVVGRRAVMEGSSGHPRMRQKSLFYGSLMWVVGIPGVPAAAGVGAAQHLARLGQAGEGNIAELLPAATAHQQAQAGPELSGL